MTLRRCPYCHEQFTPSRYHPDQVVCSRRGCQCERRSEYHRQKLTKDPTYRVQCRDSQEKWRQRHPDYMKKYRTTHERSSETTPRKTRDLDRLQQLLKMAKNNVAIDLKACPARVLLICSDKRVKNIVATAQLILIEGFPES
jgi:hypothetical protein